MAEVSREEYEHRWTDHEKVHDTEAVALKLAVEVETAKAKASHMRAMLFFAMLTVILGAVSTIIGLVALFRKP